MKIDFATASQMILERLSSRHHHLVTEDVVSYVAEKFDDSHELVVKHVPATNFGDDKISDSEWEQMAAAYNGGTIPNSPRSSNIGSPERVECYVFEKN